MLVGLMLWWMGEWRGGCCFRLVVGDEVGLRVQSASTELEETSAPCRYYTMQNSIILDDWRHLSTLRYFDCCAARSDVRKNALFLMLSISSRPSRSR